MATTDNHVTRADHPGQFRGELTDPGRRLRVLCVDDHPDTADTVKAVAEVFGYEATACYDGPSAITTAEQFQPDICLLDLDMPGMDGIALSRWLTHQAGGRPVGILAVTAMAGEEYRRRTAAAGFHRHLIKPVDPERLKAELSAVWEEALRAYSLLTTPVRSTR